MFLQNFSVYDIIVDIVPGVVFGYLIWVLAVPISKVGFTNLGLSGAGQAFLIIAVGFLIGRGLHSGSALFESFMRKNGEILLKNTEYFPIGKWYKKVHRKYRRFIGPEWSMETVLEEALIPISPFTFYTATAYELHNLLNEIYNVDFEKLDNKEGIEEFSYALLYGKNTLYRKYEILTTGFRNTYFLFLLTSILYSFVTYSTLEKPNSFILQSKTSWVEYVGKEPKLATLSVGIMFVLFILFLYQRLKFGQKRSDMLLFDSVIELQKKVNEDQE